MNSSFARFKQLLTEVERTPHLAGMAVAATAAIGMRAMRVRGGGLAGAAAGALVWRAILGEARLDRQVRNAEDAAILASRFGQAAPLFGRWAAEADFAALVSRELELAPDLVVECGSGGTTLIIASQLAINGSGRLVTLEHDAGFAELIRARLAEAGLGSRVQIVEAPLEKQSVSGRNVYWYERAAVAAAIDAPIDVLVVDGPPQREPWARWPAVEVLYSRLAPRAVVFADDGRTRSATAAAVAWTSSHPDLELYWVDTVKGTWHVRRADRPRVHALTYALAARRILSPRPVGGGRWPIRR